MLNASQSYSEEISKFRETTSNNIVAETTQARISDLLDDQTMQISKLQDIICDFQAPIRYKTQWQRKISLSTHKRRAHGKEVMMKCQNN